MINLTRQERLILIFVGFATLCGIGLNIGFKTRTNLDSLYNNVIEKRKPELKLNINLADKEDLIKIRGIGPVLAQRIVDYRALRGPFSNVEEITLVKGIGPKKFQQIKDFIKID